MRQVPLTAIIPRLSIMIYTAANRMSCVLREKELNLYRPKSDCPVRQNGKGRGKADRIKNQVIVHMHHCRIGSCFIFSSISRFSSSDTQNLICMFLFQVSILHRPFVVASSVSFVSPPLPNKTFNFVGIP